MPVIHLVRHGQASFGSEDYDALSDTGRIQASVAGAELARRAPREPLLLCGTLRRQRQTAELLAEAGEFRGEIVQDARWNEYDHLSLLNSHGAPPSSSPDNRALQDALDAALLAWIEEAGRGERDGWQQFSRQANAALADATGALTKGRDAIVVTSGGVLAALCGALLSLPAAGVVAVNRVMLNAAVTTVLAGRGGLSLLSLNDHAHLSGEREALRTYR